VADARPLPLAESKEEPPPPSEPAPPSLPEQIPNPFPIRLELEPDPVPAPPDAFAAQVLPVPKAAPLPPPPLPARPAPPPPRSPEVQNRRRVPERQPPPRRRSSWRLVLVVLGLFAAVVGGAVYFSLNLFRTGIPASAWQTHTTADGDLQVLLPGKAHPRPARMANFVMMGVELDRGQTIFEAGHGDFSNWEIQQTPLWLRFQNVRDSILGKAAGSRLVSDKDLTFNGFPGREFELSVPGQGTVLGRQCCVTRNNNNRFYLLLVSGPGFTMQSPDVRKFFESLKLTPDRVPPGQQVKNPPPLPDVPWKAPPPPPPPVNDDFQFVTRIDPSLAVAVSPLDKGLLLATGAGELGRYSYPEFKLQGAYSLNGVAYRLALDSARGLLYAAMSEQRALMQKKRSERPLGVGDIHVYDVKPILQGKVPAGSALKPTARIPLGGAVSYLFLSPDGRSLYFLDVLKPAEARIGRVDTESLKHVSEAVLSYAQCLCLTRDGKSLYAGIWTGGAGGGNPNSKTPGRIQHLDPLTLKGILSRDLLVAPFDLDATRGGRVFYSHDNSNNNTHVGLIDFKTGTGSSNWVGTYSCSYLCLAPNEQRLYVGNQDHFQPAHTVWKVGPNPLANAPQQLGHVFSNATQPLGGDFFVTPDGSYLISKAGSVFRLTGAPAGK
jgi:hypothetical protein